MKRGEIYYAAVPYLPEYPLNFFVEDLDENGKGIGTGKVIKQVPEDNFRGKKGERNPEYQVILPFKRRMVLIISGDELIDIQPSVIVMPIHTIYDEQLERPFFKRLMETNLMSEAYYLGSRLNGRSVVSIIDVKTISKTLVYDRVPCTLTPEEMEGIDLRFSDCLNNSLVLACQTCDRNCGNCKLLKASNQLHHKS